MVALNGWASSGLSSEMVHSIGLLCKETSWAIDNFVSQPLKNWVVQKPKPNDFLKCSFFECIFLSHMYSMSVL